MRKIFSILFIITFLFSQDYSLYFDGNDDYVEIMDSDILDVDTSDFTIQFWLQTNDDNRAHILSKSGSIGQQNPGEVTWYFIHMNSDGKIEYAISDGYSGSGDYSEGISNFSVNDNNLHLITVLFDRDDAGHIFIDGVLDNSVSISSHPGSLANEHSLQIGTDLDLGNHYLDGKLDEISIWNRLLSEEEIESYMEVAVDGDETGLIGYWNFNSGEGNILYDQSENQNYGTIYGAQWLYNALTGDVNSDGDINVIDITLIVAHIINDYELNDQQLELGDLNGSGIINITDIVLLVEMILYN